MNRYDEYDGIIIIAESGGINWLAINVHERPDRVFYISFRRAR